MLRLLESIGDSHAQIFNFASCCQWGPVKMVFPFFGVFFLEIFKALHLGMLRHISQVSLQIESCVRSC